MHGAAGRVGIAALELGAVAGLRLYGTASARDRAAVERLGAVAIDYRNEDFLARVRELTAGGVDVVVDGLGGPISLRSFRALRPGGRLVVFGRYTTLADGHKDWPAVIKWYAAIATVWLWDKLSPRRQVFAYHVQKYRDKATRRAGAVGGEPMDPEWFREDFARAGRAAPCGQDPPGRGRAPAARLKRAARTSCSRARRRRGSSCSCRKRTRTLADGARRPCWPSRAGRVRWGSSGTAGALPADRRARPDRRPAHRRARRHRRDDRLVLLPALRLAERLRGDPRRRPRGPVPHRARLRRLELQAALPPRHQRPHHALPDARRSGGGAGLHAPAAYRRGGAPPPHDPPGTRRARADALRRRRRPALRLRARPPRGRAHPARRALPLSRAGAQPLDALPARDRRRRRRPRAHRAPGRGDGHLRARPRRARRDAGAVLRCRHRRRVRRHRGVLAAAGCAARATAGAGARWCIARRSRSSCSRTRPPARSWPPPPPACRSSSAAHATGTTATRGCATPPSRSTRCSGSGSPRRPARS